jgi:hypothetical protein
MPINTDYFSEKRDTILDKCAKCNCAPVSQTFPTEIRIVCQNCGNFGPEARKWELAALAWNRQERSAQKVSTTHII